MIARIAKWLRRLADRIDPPNGGATFVAQTFFVPPGVTSVTFEGWAGGGGGGKASGPVKVEP